MLKFRLLAVVLGVLCWSGLAHAGAHLSTVAVPQVDLVNVDVEATPVDSTLDMVAGHCHRGGGYYRGGGGAYYGSFYRGYGGYGGYGGCNTSFYRTSYYPVVVPSYPIYRTNFYRGGWGCY